MAESDITTINESWEGHTGAEVESFLKRMLASKAGVFFEDAANSRYLVFASESDKNAYLADPANNAGLVLGSFAAGGGGGTSDGYVLNIELLSEYYTATLPSQKGLYIEFNFNVKNAQGLPTGDDALAVFTFRWNSVVKTVTQKFTAGQRARLAVDDYIGESGVTNVAISITGVTTGAATSFAVVYNKVDLALSDSFKVNTVCNLISNPNATVEVPYTLSGAGLKVMEWYIDGVLQTKVASDDEVTEQNASRTKYIPAGELSEGVHTLQFRAYTTVNGENFYSQTAYREFAVYRGQDITTVRMMIGADLNVGQLATTSTPLKLSNITQYLPYTIKVGVFDPSNSASVPVDVYLDTDKQGTLNMNNASEQEFTFTATSTAVGAIVLKHMGDERSIPVEVTQSSSSLTEITAGLSLALRALGRNNAASDRNTWTYKSITTAFTDFKWNAQSGWNDNRLVIGDGASVTVNHAPLNGDVTSSGKTLEFEFSTSSVINDDAIICDLRNGNTGLLITASEASLTSAAGAKVSVKYKSEENIRIAFVINPKSGVTNKQLVFIYVNGILSGAANYAVSDNFRVTKNLAFTSSDDATIRLKELRFYDNALSSDQVLNNYMLYRDTVAEMLEVYDRNNIYVEGTSEFSTDILSGQLPIMIVTGNIPALESTTDKNLQIEVDVEYINLQDPTRSFKMTKAAMRPQGTSSMSYPKKNFRLYTKKLAATTVYDSNGNVVADKLYAFKDGAQPVNCWCFKADYAESSGTHNTGIARLWNDVLKDAQVPQKTGVDEDGNTVFGNPSYLLRTNAQNKAMQNGYPYDVRTTIDGFPILMFYRLNANSPLVFIGKYNFNNDKSTESVFGFKDIPGFDNSRMQCWEVLNNGHHLALFQDVNRWNQEWDAAFEGRYPDGSTNTTDLKAFATWMSSVSESDFTAQKWEHMDVYKMAAYYIYLMRFGAVDQVVKNAMFTSEDGVHWYYINYDNDTINGLRNDGLLIYPPTIDRQTLDTTVTGVYAYAGHDSRMWNMLEGDTEFMDIVREVDAALYTAGLSYAKVMEVFDDKQSDKWCERIYNQDSQYKYVGPFANNNINNLFMLQGSRKSHRRWWLSRRFNLMDGKFVSGAYKDNVFEVKLAGAPIGLNFSIVSGFPMNYGYGVNNVPIQSGIFLNTGAEHQFATEAVLNVGDPLRIYAAPNIREININDFTPYLSNISIAGVYSSTLGTTLEKLVLGSSRDTVNNALNELSGISNATMLKKLYIRGYKSISTLDLSANIRLTELYAGNSGLASLTLADGAPVTTLELPSTMKIIELHNLPLLADSGLTVAGDFANVTTLRVTGCQKLDSKAVLDNWLANKTTEHSQCSVTLDGIDWTGIDPEWLMQFGNMLSVSFKGKVAITSVDETIAESLVAIFGINCFNSSAEFYIKIPAGSTVLAGPSTVMEESSHQYTAIMTDIADDITYSISPAERTNIEFSANGLLTVGLNPSPLSVLLRATSRDAQNNLLQVAKAVTIQPYTFPTESDLAITGKEVLTSNGSYAYALQVQGEPYSGQFIVEWSLEKSGSVGAAIESNGRSCTLLLTTLVAGEYVKVKATVKKTNGEVIAVKEFTSLMVDSSVIMTAVSNPNMMAYMYSKGYAAKPTYMTIAEAEAVTEILIDHTLNDAANTDFDEFKYFSNVTKYQVYGTLKSITLPWVVFNYCGYAETYNYYNTIRATTINLPYTTTINLGSSFFNADYGQSVFECHTFNAPVLRKIVATESVSGGKSSVNHTVVLNVEHINVPELEEIDLTLDISSSSIRVFFLNGPTDGAEFEFPKLRTLKCYEYSTTRNAFLAHVGVKSTILWTIKIPMLSNLWDGKSAYLVKSTSGASSGIYPALNLYMGGSVSLPASADYLCLYAGSPCASTLDAPNATGVCYIWGGILQRWKAPKSSVRFNSSSPYSLEELSCYTISSANENYDLNAPKLSVISIHSPEAPVFSSGTVSSTLGSSVPSTTTKMLYLKQGATGYDAEVWNKPPLSNYTKSFTL